MERIHKYRFWDTWNENMVHQKPHYYEGISLNRLFSSYSSHERGGNNPILMQSVGKLDVGDKLIYQHDILKTFHFEDNEGEAHYLYHLVEWSREYASLFAVNARDKSFEEPKRGNGTIPLWIYMKNSEPIIAGNKHANPELLEE